MTMYSRSFSERVKIQVEIICESCMDSIGHYYDTTRKPIFFFIAIILLLTLRSARKGASMTRGFGFNPFGKKAAYSPYGMNAPYGGSTSQYGGATSQYGGVGGVAGTSQYGGVGGVAGSSQYGRSTSTTYRGAVPATTGNLRGGTSSYVRPVSPMATQQQASSVVNTANLVDMHGANVQVVQGLQFNDYTMTTSFMGQIETVSAMESPSFVQQTLQSPGLGKILVVDGGASLNAAILDSAAVSMAQQNGWKGIIVNGAIRNADSMKSSQIGVKALGTHPSRGQQTMGQRSMPLTIGGINLSPGQWVYADKDGIVVSQTALPVGTGTGSIAPPQQYQPAGATNTYNTATSNTYNTPNAYGTQGYTPGGAINPSTTRQQSQYNSAGQQQYGGSSSAQRYGQASTGGGLNQQYGSQKYGSSSTYGGTHYGAKPKTSKKKMISGVVFVSAVVWLCLGD